MKNGDNNFNVVTDRNKPATTIRADQFEICPDGTLLFVTYSGPRSGRMPVKAFAPGVWDEVTYVGENRD